MNRILLAFALVFVITATADSRCLLNTQDLAWTSGIGKECQSVCSSSLVFSSPFGSSPASYSCRINLGGGITAAGFQTASGQCTADSNGQAVTSSDYDCGCLSAASIPGLDNPVGSSCTTACSKSIAGSSGASLLDGTGSVCMPTSEMGVTNHFGSTSNGQCNYVALDGTAHSTNAFSCVCSFGQASLTTG